MRQKRAKLYRKLIHQYHLHFGFREPYQMLMDDSFALALTRLKVQNPDQQFINLLQGKVKPMITQCCMVALYQLGKEFQSTVDLAKNWERRKCNHREAISVDQCVTDVIGSTNKHRYVLASEDVLLRRKLRKDVIGLPMAHFTQSVLVMEPMSDMTRQKAEEMENNKLSIPLSEISLLKRTESSSSDQLNIITSSETEESTSSKKSRKIKTPNPLSVKKPKKQKLSQLEKLELEQVLKKQKQAAAAAVIRLKQDNPKKRQRDDDADESTLNTTTEQKDHNVVVVVDSQLKKKRQRRKTKSNGEKQHASNELVASQQDGPHDE